MYVGNIKLASAKGRLTKAGYAWIKMGGVDPARYSGELIVDGDSKYVMDSGRRVDILKLHQTPKGPEWRPTKKGYLRFREHNQWEVMIPAIGHAKDKNGRYRQFKDRVVITDAMVTRNDAFGELDAEPALTALMAYTTTRAVQDHQAQKDFIRAALQAHWKSEFPREWRAGRGEIVIARASDAYWTLDVASAKAGEGFTYDWRETFVAEGRLRTSTILYRALRGVPYVPIDMARQMDLIPEAHIDLEGFCVPIQMQLCLTKRYKPHADGQRTYVRSTEPLYSVEELKDFLEQIHEKVHGPRPGQQPTVFQQPTAVEQAKLGVFDDAWKRFIPLVDVKDFKWLRERNMPREFRGLPHSRQGFWRSTEGMSAQTNAGSATSGPSSTCVATKKATRCDSGSSRARRACFSTSIIPRASREDSPRESSSSSATWSATRATWCTRTATSTSGSRMTTPAGATRRRRRSHASYSTSTPTTPSSTTAPRAGLSRR